MLNSRRVLVGLLILVAVSVTVGIVIGVIYFARQRAVMSTDIAEGNRLPQELAAAKRAHLPLTMGALQVPMPPPAQNAAPIYVHLSEILQSSPLTPDQKKLEEFNLSHTPTNSEWAGAAAAIHQRSDIYALIHQVASRPRCVFSRDWNSSDPINIRFPEFATVREAERLLTAESLTMAHQGQFTGAIKNETLGFAIARQGASDQTAISYLVGIACDAITLAGLKKIVYLSQGAPAVSASVQSAIERNWKPRSLSAALRSEIAFEQGEIDYLQTTGPSGLMKINPELTKGMNSVTMQQNWPMLLQINREFLLRNMSHSVAIANEPYLKSLPQLRKIDNAVMDRSNLPHVISVVLWPVPEQLAEKRAQIQTTANVDRAGCAVFIARGKTGHLPEHLPGTFMDSFTDKPLHFRREGSTGFVVYSAGPDGNFDGGKPGVKQKNNQTYFRYPFVPEN